MSLDFGKLNFSVSFNPTSAFPLDSRSYFESYDAAVAAAATADVVGSSTTTYYFGETVAVVENNIATLYTIQPDKTLAEVGGKVEINEDVFAHTPEGALDLYGFADAVAGAQLLKGADGKLSWVKPDETTVEGLQTAVAALREDVDNIVGVIGSKTESTGLAGDIAAVETALEGMYTSEETDSAIATAIANAPHVERKTVASVDEIDPLAEGAEKFIYMVAKTGEDGDHYDEYMVLNGTVEKVGNWAVDLSDYAKTTDVETALAGKVDVVDGSRLITDAEVLKLEGIATGAQVNVIDAVSSEFSISADGKTLNVNAIDLSKITGLSDALLSKVDAVEGKGLSTNDLTDELLTKLNNVDANVIEIVKLNNVALEVTDKAVNIPVASAAGLGLVKSSTGENKVTVNADGEMEVSSINVNSLVQAEGDVLILNGGTSSK